MAVELGHNAIGIELNSMALAEQLIAPAAGAVTAVTSIHQQQELNLSEEAILQIDYRRRTGRLATNQPKPPKMLECSGRPSRQFKSYMGGFLEAGRYQRHRIIKRPTLMPAPVATNGSDKQKAEHAVATRDRIVQRGQLQHTDCYRTLN